MLRKLQYEQAKWAQQNFGDQPSWQPLLGLVEEVGELAHAHLKHAQGIRNHEGHEALAKDAVGDIMIFLASYCSRRGWDLESIAEETWERVKQRDWRADPETAHEDGE